MITIRALACIVLACLASAAEMKTKVTVYEGPQECDAHEKVTPLPACSALSHAPYGKVKKGDYVGMHYVGKIDQSSKTGTKGLQYDAMLVDSPLFCTYSRAGVHTVHTCRNQKRLDRCR